MASRDAADGCSLCGLATPEPPITDPAVDGEFCCQGCLAVQDALGSTTLDADALDHAEEDADEPIDGETVFLAIDGMHCTTCEAFLAARGRHIDGVYRVDASYATDTARVTYDPDRLTREELAETLSGFGYTARAKRDGDRSDPRGGLWARFLIGGGLFGMMVMLWYAIFLYPTYFGFDPVVELGGFDGLYIYANIWLFTSFVLFYTGYPILRGAVVSVRAGAPNMDLLVTIAALSAYSYSTVAMLVGRSDLYFDVSVAIILVVTAGTYYEGVMKRRALAGIDLEAITTPDTVRTPDGTEIEFDAIEPGMEVLVRPGERIPVDGTITEGTAAIETALLTGEAIPETFEPGDAVAGGAIVTNAPIVLEVHEDLTSTRDRLVALLWSIQTDQPGVQRLADRLATIFVPLVLVLAVLVGSVSLVYGTTGTTALLLSLTVLIVACPCALGLATPLGIAAGVRDGLRRGILITRASIFEEAPAVRTVVLDKTGTLTAGELVVTDVIGDESGNVLERAAALERYSSHPVAGAITSFAESDFQADGGMTEVRDITYDSRGLFADVDGEWVGVGHPSLLREQGFESTDSQQAAIETIVERGEIPVAVGWAQRVQGIIAIGDEPRHAWEAAVERIGDGRTVVILTGDAEPAANRFRANPAIDSVFAGVPPEGKAATVKRLQEDGPVAMVGDGSNDAPALAQADVGIALTGATPLATDAADAIIQSEDLAAAADLFDVIGGTNTRIKQNLGWAFVYNGIAIPLAMMGLLNPFLAAVAMATSSILVVSNSARSVISWDR